MQRLRAEVLTVESNGEVPAEVRLGVRVTGSAWLKIKLPEGVKGRERTVTRRLLFPWQVQAGDSLLLTPDEVAEVLCPAPAAVVAAAAKGGTARSEGDLDRDGYAEQCLANLYLQAVLAPAVGGRIASLRHARTGREALAVTPLPGYDGPTPGGFVDGLAGADALATSEYTLAEVDDELVAVGIELDKPFKGHLARTVGLAPDTPLLELATTIRRRRDDEDKGKQKQDEAAATPTNEAAKAKRASDDEEQKDPPTRYEPLLRVALGGLRPSNDTELLLPTSDGLRRMRWDRGALWVPASRPRSAGFVAAYDRRAKLGLALLVRPGRDTRIGFPEQTSPDCLCFAPQFETWRLKPGEQRTIGVGLVLADALDATADALATATLGAASRGRTPLFLLARGAAERVVATVAVGGTRRKVTLGRVRRRTLGDTFEATLSLPGDGLPGTAEVVVGAERLVLRW